MQYEILILEENYKQNPVDAGQIPGIITKVDAESEALAYLKIHNLLKSDTYRKEMVEKYNLTKPLIVDIKNLNTGALTFTIEKGFFNAAKC